MAESASTGGPRIESKTESLRQTINAPITEPNANVAESGAGRPALHPFVPKGVGRGGYSATGWSKPFLDIMDPIVEELGIDAVGHPDKLEEIMTRKGYTMNSGDLWEKDGETIPFNFFLPEFWKHYGPPLAQMLREGGFDATFDTSPGKSELHSAGEIPYFGCRGPSGVQGMDPWFMMDAYHTRHNVPTGDPGAGWMPDRWSNTRFDEIVDEIKTLDVESPRMFELFEEGCRSGWTSCRRFTSRSFTSVTPRARSTGQAGRPSTTHTGLTCRCRWSS